MFSNSDIFSTGQALISITLLLLYTELKCLPVVENKTGKKHFKISVPPRHIKTYLGAEFSGEKCSNLGFKWLISMPVYFPWCERFVSCRCHQADDEWVYTLCFTPKSGNEMKSVIKGEHGVVTINRPFNAPRRLNHEGLTLKQLTGATEIICCDKSLNNSLTERHRCHTAF